MTRQRKDDHHSSPSLRKKSIIINESLANAKKKKTNQVKKPSIGLTQTSDDNTEDMTATQLKKVQAKASTSRGKRKQEAPTGESDDDSSTEENAKKSRKMVQKKCGKLDKKKSGKQNEECDGNSDQDDTKKTLDVEQRLRHKLSIPKVYDLMLSINEKRRKQEILNLLNASGFGGMTHICKWTKIHTFFVEWVVKNFEKDNMWIRLSKTDVLPLSEEDVHRVYALPMEGQKINVDQCSVKAIKKLRRELGFEGNYTPIVKVSELEAKLKMLETPRAWVKGAICLIIHNILCPTNSSFISLFECF